VVEGGAYDDPPQEEEFEGPMPVIGREGGREGGSGGGRVGLLGLSVIVLYFIAG